MSRRIAVALAWVAATLLSILIASAAVGSVRNQVSDTPSPLRSASVTQIMVAASSTTAAPGEDTTSSTATEPPTATSPSSTSTSTSTTLSAPSSSTVTTSPTTTSTKPPATIPPTTTTSLPEEEIISSYPQIGGTTTIATDGTGVSLVAAVPKPGFQVEVKKSGPQEVEVRYRSTSHLSKFKAEWEHGSLDVETSEEAEDD